MIDIDEEKEILNDEKGSASTSINSANDGTVNHSGDDNDESKQSNTTPRKDNTINKVALARIRY